MKVQNREVAIAQIKELCQQHRNHNQLPDKDNNFVKNYREPLQGDLLTEIWI